VAAIIIDDAIFGHENAIGFAGENSGRSPTYFKWSREDREHQDLKVFTDASLKRAVDDPTRRKVALIIEPYCLRPGPYETAADLTTHFDAIFTHHRNWARIGSPWRWYPFGGSWIADWPESVEKTRLVSLLTSRKSKTAGHNLRHHIAGRFGDLVDVMGEPYTPRLQTKRPALEPYAFSIIIESCAAAGFFTEKIIDCFALRTVPIYWGAPDIYRYFNPDGMIIFQTLGELERILKRLTFDQYLERQDAIIENAGRARAYQTPEDWLYVMHPEFFATGTLR